MIDRTCSKKYFKDKKTAKKWMKETNRSNKFESNLTSVYNCDICGGYHTTTQPKRLRSKIRHKVNKRKNGGKSDI